MTTTHFEVEKIVGKVNHPYFSFSRKGQFLSNAFFEVLGSSAGFNKVCFRLPYFLIFFFDLEASAFVSGPLYPIPEFCI